MGVPHPGGRPRAAAGRCGPRWVHAIAVLFGALLLPVGEKALRALCTVRLAAVRLATPTVRPGARARQAGRQAGRQAVGAGGRGRARAAAGLPTLMVAMLVRRSVRTPSKLSRLALAASISTWRLQQNMSGDQYEYE